MKGREGRRQRERRGEGKGEGRRWRERGGERGERRGEKEGGGERGEEREGKVRTVFFFVYMQIHYLLNFHILCNYLQQWHQHVSVNFNPSVPVMIIM